MRLAGEQCMLRDVARDFARTRLAPFAAERDREEKFPADALAELGKLGFMGMLVPEEYGGAGPHTISLFLGLAGGACLGGAAAPPPIPPTPSRPPPQPPHS